MKIKPLRKKHRFLRWLEKLFGIRRPPRVFAEHIGAHLDEMHTLKCDAPESVTLRKVKFSEVRPLTDEQKELYTNTMRRLSLIGRKDTTSQILCLAEEIEYYRDRIRKMEKSIKERTERYKGVIAILEQDIADRDKMLESKVEEIYAEFMRDYRQMREELEELNAELAEEKAKNKQLKEERDNAN